MAEIILHENESIDSALKRFNKKVQQEGIFSEWRKREHYEKPCVKRKKKEAIKLKKSIKTSQRAAMF